MPKIQNKKPNKKDQKRHKKPQQEDQYKVNKTKPINKSKLNPKKQIQSIKGNTIFKIIPMNENDQEEDQFNAIGHIEDDEQGQQYDDAQFDNGQVEVDDEQLQDQEDQEQIQQEQDEEKKKEQNQEGVQKKQEQQPIQEQQQQQQQQNVDISVINMQIQQTLSILMNITKLGDGKSRKFYIDKLKEYIHKYYGYNFQLIDHFMDMFNPNELIQFFQANQTQRPLTIRCNTLKTRRKQLAQALMQRGVNLDPLAQWSKVGIKIYESKVPIGATPQYLAGYYMIQSASSFLPVLALNPQMNERVLDMAAAPGGKTTYIAQLMKNTGCIFANDLKKQRLRALQFNLYRMGISNTIVTCRDGRKYPKLYPSSFDRVLLDAPCTGLGIISKDKSIKANRVLIDIHKNSHVQRQLLLAAIDCCKVGGTVVYSTCSVSPLQNEAVVHYALKRRHIKLVQCEIQVGEEGLVKFGQKRFHIQLRKTRRIYPHVHNMDGFYVAKIVKTAKGKKDEDKQENKIKEE